MAIAIGTSPTNVNNARKREAPSAIVSNCILRAFPQVSPRWLDNGSGEMLIRMPAAEPGARLQGLDIVVRYNVTDDTGHAIEIIRTEGEILRTTGYPSDLVEPSLIGGSVYWVRPLEEPIDEGLYLIDGKFPRELRMSGDWEMQVGEKWGQLKGKVTGRIVAMTRRV